jgi:hypothetical protein
MILVFKNPDITISAQCCCGMLQGLHTIIKLHCLDMLTGGALMHENPDSHMACTVHNADSMCLKTLDTPQYSLALSSCDLLVFSPFKKAQKVRQKCPSQSSAVVSASVQGDLLWGWYYLDACLNTHGTIFNCLDPEQVSFEQALFM